MNDESMKMQCLASKDNDDAENEGKDKEEEPYCEEINFYAKVNIYFKRPPSVN